MFWDGRMIIVFLTSLCFLHQDLFVHSYSSNSLSEGINEESLPKNLVNYRVKRSEDSDYNDYQSDGRFENDPQFPTYSNWQPADDLGSFRINSPRRQEAPTPETDDDEDVDDGAPEEISLGAGGETGVAANPGGKLKDSSYISVKLPDDIMQHLGRQYGLDNSKHVQKQILGIPSDHLESLNFEEESKNKKSESHTKATTTSTTISSTTHENKNKGFHNSYKNREQEYYSKKDLLPKLTKDKKDPKSVEKAPEQNPVTPGSRSLWSLWSVAWQAHIYFSGTLFILLAIYCTVNVCRLHTFSRLFSRGYFLSLNICMIIIGLFRGLFLLFDPYNENQSLPTPMAYMLLNIGYPCITSAFAILFLALLRVTQVELLSPSVQTPKALAVFCCIHIAISLCLDITVGLMSRLQYILLLGQGIFIVWSLLLSAGYFYIYSTMKKVVSRQQCDINRSMYPKLMFDQNGSGSYSMRLPPSGSNPLSRAVNLTLGVAVIGSLMGGVQLYGMIGMHGLLRSDPKDIPDPWYGYQVALRVFEVMICYLLAVVATTPLRSDSGHSPRGGGRGPCTSCSPLLCCNGEGGCDKCGGGESPRHQLEVEDIYTEICTNNPGTVRVLNTVDSYGQPMIPLNTGTQSTNNSSIALSTSGHQLTSTLMRKKQPVAGRSSGSHVSGESNATQDTALYSNLRSSSRPSSMLFNDAGFVRFRLGNDPSLAQAEMLRQSCEELAMNTGEVGSSETVVNPSVPDNNAAHGSESTMKGSRSFDNAVLDKKQLSGDSFRMSPLERPQSNMSYVKEISDGRAIKSELCSPDRPDVELLPGLPQRPASKLATHSHPVSARMESESDTGGEQYETPAGMVLPGASKSLAAQVRSVVGYSESDLSSVDPLYGGRSIYGYSRAPSRCSSISATQSFDMRVYGRTGFGASGAATLGRPVDKSKLDNKYYYYGSSKGQKNSGLKENQTLTPRPLLPSQRNPRLGPSPTPPTASKQVQGQPPQAQATPAQSLYDQIMGRDQTSPKLPNFQRSRSLGHHYQRGSEAGLEAGGQQPSHLPPRPPGPRTPTSVARKVFESVTKRRNKDKHLKHVRPQFEPKMGYMTSPGPGQLFQTPDGRIVTAPPGPLIQLEDGRLVPAPGPLVQLEDGRVVALAQPPMAQRGQVRSGIPDRDQMLYGTREEILTRRDAYNQAHAMGILGDKLSYLSGDPSQTGEPIYERRGDMINRQQYRLQDGRQVLGTPTSGRHNADGDRQAAARLAGQHYLASPPDLHSRRGQRSQDNGDDDSDYQPSQATQGYSDALADNELDSEISSLFGGGEGREARLGNLHLMSPLEYAAMLKQYTEPCGLLGQDITPDSGVVVDSRHHSKERENQDTAKQKREHFLISSRAATGGVGGGAGASANKNDAAVNESTESSDSGSSFGGSRGNNESSLQPHRNGRYIRVPTNEDQGEKSREEGRDVTKRDFSSRHRQPSSLSEPELVTDSEAVSETNTENSGDGAVLSESDYDGGGGDRAELHPAAEKIATVCNEIKQRFQSDRLNTDDENVI